jgi:hypothetical protein
VRTGVLVNRALANILQYNQLLGALSLPAIFFAYFVVDYVT